MWRRRSAKEENGGNGSKELEDGRQQWQHVEGRPEKKRHHHGQCKQQRPARSEEAVVLHPGRCRAEM